ncbi:serine hydrolase domain-containing protein [Dyella subtropica]|uniref:serine hydrolase domain-containing protein n=1 Tax=Dyella subtropica TaxID=2992127 RepID=UPI002253F0D9|nr:serine hydrolase [Dyella subtropica]
MVLRALKITLVTLLVAILGAAIYLNTAGRDLMRTATGSVSRSLCATTFLSRLDPDRMFDEEQRPLMSSIAWAIHYDVDRARREVRTSVLGGFAARAVFREGLGCLLVHGNDPVPEAAGFESAPIASPYPQAEVVEPTDPAIHHALDRAFAEADPAHPRLTKAVVVLHNGQLIGERYAAGYGPDTPIYAHSLTKSVVNALIGVLVHQGKLRLDQPAPVAAWRSAADPRHAITVDQLLRMDSGLPFDETDGAVNPMSHMLFLERDMAGYAARTPLAHPPGTAWGYSNLSYVLLSQMIRDAAGGGAVDAGRFMRHELFEPLGMRNAVIETDATGTPVGSSNVYASARDFARFGQLYLDDGVVDGRRILPEGWVDYSHSQTLKTGYGAGFWTNLVNEGSVPVWDAPWGMPQLPKDMFYARGALGQYVVIVPSEHLVVVRMGITVAGSTKIGDMVADIIAALHRQPSQS